jgi:hypothetical protein
MMAMPAKPALAHRASASPVWARGSSATQVQPDRIHPPHSWERVAHAAVGVGFGCAAIGNLVGFLPRATELLPWFAETAWLPPYSWLLSRLVEIAPAVVAASAGFEAIIAALLLSRRHVRLGLGLATGWVLGLIPAIGWPYWTPNVALGSLLAVLWIRASRTRGDEQR